MDDFSIVHELEGYTESSMNNFTQVNEFIGGTVLYKPLRLLENEKNELSE